MTAKRKKNRSAPTPASYRKRTYRNLGEQGNLASFLVTVRETDLQILASQAMEETAYERVFHYRAQLESYLGEHPQFLASLRPLPLDATAPALVKSMLRAGQAAEVGPMAAVAGAIAEYVGRDLLAAGAAEVVVENGGDIYLARKEESVIGIFAGPSPLSKKIGLKIPAGLMPLGVCTSSGTVGHSLSLGEADSVTVLAADTSLADAVATRLGNEVSPGRGLDGVLAIARAIPGLLGVVIIRGEDLGAWGAVELVPLA
ncbi:UPF0280 family protein [Thiovibrio sp. JS02]